MNDQLERDMGALRESSLAQLPGVLRDTYAGTRKALEALTKRACSEDATDDEIREAVKEFLKAEKLEETADVAPLAGWLESSMGSAMAAGVVSRRVQIETLKKKKK
ncbi:MAG: hypothetical protein RR250_02885 [Akkermansia sp.]